MIKRSVPGSWILALAAPLYLAAPQSGANSIIYEIDNGDPANKIDIVIIGDGYTAAERSKFNKDAKRIADTIFEEPPFSDYRPLFNVIFAFVESAESGADKPDDEIYVDTALDASYSCVPGIERSLCINNAKAEQKLTDLGVRQDQRDIRLAVVNDSKYGGAGGAWPTASTALGSGDIAVHEIGHSFGYLGDEYWNDEDDSFECGIYGRYDYPNISRTAERSEIPWNLPLPSGETGWIDDDRSLPSNDRVNAWPGAYPGGNHCSDQFRPTYGSKMRYLDATWEQVNTDLLISRMWDSVSPVSAIQPAEGRYEFTTQNPPTLPIEIELVGDIPTLAVSWTLNDQTLADSTSTFDVSNLGVGEHIIRAKVFDGSTALKYERDKSVVELAWEIVIYDPESDQDSDGVIDKDDAFPNNPNETLDTDSDGIGDNTDTDDDNDGILDEEDDNPKEWLDADLDTIHDFVDNCPARSNTNQADDDGDGRPDACPDRAALIDLFDQAEGPNWTNSTHWSTATDYCEWYGVICNSDKRVTELSLYSNNLSGQLPSTLYQLSELERIDLAEGEMTGTIPVDLANLTRLRFLDLSENKLIGSIPEGITQLSNLSVLNLARNALQGSIPAELGNLSNLSYLNLTENELQGEIPRGLGNLDRLWLMGLGFNQLSGSIPQDIANSSSLTWIGLYYNALSGPIPEALDRMSQLESFYVEKNQLTGRINEDLGGFIAGLDGFQLWGNRFACPYPSALTDYFAQRDNECLIDDDGDGVTNDLDAFPQDVNETTDSDSDGVGDNSDAFPEDSTETTDTDQDGTGDNQDTDDDNDGFSDTLELDMGSDPTDKEDFPSNPLSPGLIKIIVDRARN